MNTNPKAPRARGKSLCQEPAYFPVSSGTPPGFGVRQSSAALNGNRKQDKHPERRGSAAVQNAAAIIKAALELSIGLPRLIRPRVFFAVGCAIAISTATVRAAAPTNAPAFEPIAAIDGVARPDNLDLLLLNDGETLRGTLTNPELTLHTAYGNILLKTEWLAGITIDQTPDHADQIDTINRNRFNGFLDGPFSFRDETSEMKQIAKTAVRRIIFHRRPTEVNFAVTRRFVVLDTGDFFSGQLRDWEPQSENGTGALNAGLDEIELVQFQNGGRQLHVLRRDGREENARLTNDALRVELDLGPEITLPTSQLKTLFARSGTLPLLAQQAFNRVGASTNSPAMKPPAATPDGMVWIPPGRFQMGSMPGEQGHGTDEVPPTEVIITRGFWMGKYEVTQEEYAALMGVNPSGFQGGTNRPVESVTWNEANAYCNKKTTVEHEGGRLPAGFVYRLPTEAEWEYACRAGTTTRFSFGDDLTNTELVGYGWFIDNSDSTTHAVGRLKPNPWGLYDMHGNVWEWCHDLWEDAYPGGTVTNYTGPTEGWLRVARGGSWLYDAAFCRSANRDNYGPDNRCSDIGFRVVLGRPL